jgi:hypothetical protein
MPPFRIMEGYTDRVAMTDVFVSARVSSLEYLQSRVPTWRHAIYNVDTCMLIGESNLSFAVGVVNNNSAM